MCVMGLYKVVGRIKASCSVRESAAKTFQRLGGRRAQPNEVSAHEHEHVMRQGEAFTC